MKRVTGNFSKPPEHAKLRLRDGGGLPGAAPGPLAQGPLSSQFWGDMGQGVRDTVAPMAREVLNTVQAGHDRVNEVAPLPYQMLQAVYPPVGITAAGLDYRRERAEDKRTDAALASLASVPVHEPSYGAIGSAPARSVAQAATSHPIPGAGVAAALLPKWAKPAYNAVTGTTYKAAAGLTAAQMGTAGFKQTQVLRGDAPGPFYGGN